MVDQFGERELRAGLVVSKGEAGGWGSAGGSRRRVGYRQGHRRQVSGECRYLDLIFDLQIFFFQLGCV